MGWTQILYFCVVSNIAFIIVYSKKKQEKLKMSKKLLTILENRSTKV